MALFARGTAWMSGYLAFVIAPTAIAVWADPFPGARPALVELSAGLGLVAFPLVLAQFALVSRLRAGSRPFGTDALLQFHRDIGATACVFAAAHAVSLNAAGTPWSAWIPVAGRPVTASGAVAAWGMGGLLLTTFGRRRLGLSYEAWRTVHLALSLTVAAAMAVHLQTAGGYVRIGPLRALLFAYLSGSAAIVVTYRLVRPWRLRSRPWVVTSNIDEGGRTRTLTLRPEGHAGFAFDPGQFAWLVTGPSPFSAQEHPLSIASSAERPADGSIQFAVKALGDWSGTVVPSLSTGARVWVDGPFGAFTIEGRAGQGFVLLAGGIGIAPMLSVLRTMRDRGDRRHVVLFYLGRNADRLPFRAELDGLSHELNLDIVSRAEPSPGAGTDHAGHLTKALLSEHLPPHHRRYHYFVCGPPAMMDAVETMLHDLGVDAASVDSERYYVV